MRKLILFAMLFILFCIPAKASYAKPDVTSGKCGEDVYWNYDEATFTLTISGNGKITSNPWRDYFDEGQIGVNLVIEKGITSIGKNIFVFEWFGNVSIGPDVVEIEQSAFSDTYIEKLELSDSVKKIGESAFNSGGRLKELNLKNVEEVGECAFEGFTHLEKVTFGKNLKKISKSAFEGCLSLKEVEFQGGAPKIAKNAFKDDRFLKVIINHSESSIPLGKLDKDLTWYQEGKKVTTISPGKTAKCKGRLFKVKYKDLKGTFEGKLPKTYRYAEDKYLPTKGKRKGYFFYGWSDNGYYWLSDLCDLRGNITLMPIWIRYDVKKMNATTRRFSYSIEKKYDYFYSRTAQIRYSADKGMKKAKTLWCDNLWKGSFTIKNLKKGKKYYVQFRTRDEDSKSPWSNPIRI